MNISFPKNFFYSALAVALFSSDSLLVAVDADVFNHVEVECLPSSPTICIGEVRGKTPTQEYTCPDLPDTTTCGYHSTSTGGYEWEFFFVDGLQDGEGNFPVIESAKTGLEVKVVVEDTFCSVSNGDGETCLNCAICDSPPTAVQYDCTNLVDGRSSNGQCESLEPFLYPFDLGAGVTIPVASPTAGVPVPSSSSQISGLGSLTLPLAVTLFGF